MQLQSQVFRDLKVIELANVLAGPAVGMFFAELGAKVIKIENSLTGGDVTRQWKLSSEDPSKDTSAYFCSVNWNKQHIFLDLTSKEGKQQLLELVKDADIVISNYKPGDDKKLGVDHASLSDINPRLIYGSITGFGDNDPRVAYDLVLQAETGFMSMNGTQESGPVKMPVALIDILAAHQLKEAILIGLLERERIGKGSCFSVSLFDAAVASLANQASNWLMAGHVAQRLGSLHPNIAPYGEIFTASDQKQLVLAVGSDSQFRALCRILKLEQLAEDDRFSTNPARVRHRQELASALQPAISTRASAELLQLFAQHGVPAGAIRNIEEVMALPRAQEMVIEDKNRGKRVRTVAFRRKKQ
jgi:crotonobetainyl-CoA:carnitine CoA-transferase CaiB-like acyl-CoA transferase